MVVKAVSDRAGWRGLVWLAIIVSVISCGANLAPGSPTRPGGTIQPTSALADQLEANVRNQLYDPGKRDFRLAVSDDQITSYLALRYRNLSLENPQVWFAQGQVYLRGTYTGLCLYHPDVLMIAKPTLRGSRISVDVQQLSIGSFILPPD